MPMKSLLHVPNPMLFRLHGLMQERRNSIANALELRLSCTNPSIESLSVKYDTVYKEKWYDSDLFDRCLSSFFIVCQYLLIE